MSIEMHLRAAMSDLEYYLAPVVGSVVDLYIEHKDEVEGLYEHYPDLDDFTDKARDLWLVTNVQAKLLYDACVIREGEAEGRFDVSVTLKSEGDPDIVYPGISYTKGWGGMYVALVYDEGTVADVFYGFDPDLMRVSIGLMYGEQFDRPPQTIIMTKEMT